MNIRIELLSMKMEHDVIRIGGVPTYYDDLHENFQATFFHHELTTRGDWVTVLDNLTGEKIIFNRNDFYMIELI